MRVRKDGEETRQKILDAAYRVFGEKGYRDATHAEICELAQVNTAAINYHFGSKDALYVAVWEHVLERAETLYPFDGGVPSDAPPEERLRGIVRAFLLRKGDRDQLAHFHSIHMMELVNPTGLIDESLAAWRERSREHIRSVLEALLGPGASSDEIALCQMSVISQCLMARKGPQRSKLHPPWRAVAEDLDRAVEHIVKFSLAGVAAIRADREGRANH